MLGTWSGDCHKILVTSFLRLKFAVDAMDLILLSILITESLKIKIFQQMKIIFHFASNKKKRATALE